MTDQPSKPKRRRFQFSLRTLLIAVTLAAGLLVAWRAYVEPYRRQRETMVLIKELGGYYKTELGGPAWMRDWFGADNFQNIAEVSLQNTKVSDADLAHLKGLAHLQTLDLVFTEVSNAGLAHLKGLKTLVELQLSGSTQITDTGLAHLKGLVNLQTLDLCLIQVSDAGLVHLKGLTKLRLLNLCATQVGDAGLAHLKGLVNLHTLDLGLTEVSDTGVKELQKELPTCRITYSRDPVNQSG